MSSKTNSDEFLINQEIARNVRISVAGNGIACHPSLLFALSLSRICSCFWFLFIARESVLLLVSRAAKPIDAVAAVRMPEISVVSYFLNFLAHAFHCRARTSSVSQICHNIYGFGYKF